MLTRKYILLLMLCLLATSIHAKNTDSLRIPKERRSEIGIILPIADASIYNTSDFALYGVQYRRMPLKNFGFRIVAGWGLYNNDETTKSSGSYNDTMKETSVYTMGNMAVLGVGLDAQKQLYKKIYLTAAIELKGGYGNGTAYTTAHVNYRNRPNDTYYNTSVSSGYTNINLLYISISPVLGAKIQLKRITAGLEMHVINVAFQNVSNSPGRQSFIGRSDFMQRLSINYRF